MTQELRILYADLDDKRSEELRNLLRAVGFLVTAIDAKVQLTSDYAFGVPDAVIIDDRMEPTLRPLTSALWPSARVFVLTEKEDYRHLPHRLRSTFPGSDGP